MLRKFASLPLAALVLAGCGDAPTGAGPADATGPSTSIATPGEIVLTAGAMAPARLTGSGIRPVLSSVGPVAILAGLTGSTSTPLVLTPSSCAETATGTVTIRFRVEGAQAGTATFKVSTKATWNGSAWSYSDPVTKTVVGPRGGGDPATEVPVEVTVVNASASGASTPAPPVVSLLPYDITNSNSTGAKLDTPPASASARIHVAFADCAVTNTPPVLILPSNIVAEATSSAGAVVTFTATADDNEDGTAFAAPSCSPASGSTFPIGTTTVNCAVTDSHGVETTGSFTIEVEDSTPAYFTSFPSGTVNLIASDIDGAALDIDALGITVEDWNNVSEPSTFACSGAAGTLGIGTTTTVSCTATDARGNESTASTFTVFVGLNVSPVGGFLSPLRMAAPFSSHKLNSTIPHKFLPPTYADGTPATDLADGLNLTLKRLDGTPDATSIEANDFSAGSTAWRYDVAAGHYIFNAKTETKAPWAAGTWQTTVSYKGVEIATTRVDLKK